MFEKPIIFISLFLAVVLQTSFLPNFFSSGAVPDLILLLVVFWAAKLGFEGSWKRAVLAGLMADLAFFNPVGINILSFATVAFVISYLAKRFLVAHQAWKFAIMLVLVAIGALTNELVGVLALKATAELRKIKGSVASLNFDHVFLLRMFYDLAVFAIIYLPLEKLGGSFTLKQKIKK